MSDPSTRWSYRLQVLANVADRFVPKFVRSRLRRLMPGLADGVYKELDRLSPEGDVEVVVQAGPLQGRPFVCSLKISRAYFLGNHEPETVAYLGKLVARGDVVVEAGGHSGYMALILSQLVGSSGRVYVYEPSPLNRAVLERNLGLNRDLAERITVRPYAVADRAGSMTFEEDISWKSRLSSDSSGSSGTTVEVVTLDEECERLGVQPTIVMMDIEGAETAAFQGMRQLMTRRRPNLVVELHDLQAYNAFLALIAEFSYEATVIGTDSWSLRPDWRQFAQYAARPSKHAPA